jgi:FxsC-like protein
VPVFFFSYANDDALDPYLDRFYEDLCAEVSTRGGYGRARVGFRDRDQAAGADWPSNVSDALGECPVFVPVYSPNYFNSTVCGQEWHAFSARLAAHEKATGEKRDNIIPVWWVPPMGALPPVTHHVNDTRRQFGAEYRDGGLRYLVQLAEHESRYRDFLVKFAMTIITASQAPPGRAEIPDLLSLPSAFAADGARSSPPGTRSASSGPRNVTFIVAAAGRDEMRDIQTMLEKYGDDWRDWRPYHPGCPDPIAVRAQSIAATQRMISAIGQADDSLFPLLQRAREQGEVVVLLVDPWAASLPAYGPLLERLNTVRSSYAAVVVPWETRDVLSTQHGRHAHDALYAKLGDWVDGGNLGFRDDMWSIDDFEKILGQIVIEIRARIINRADLARRVTEGGPTVRPIIIGPGG